jgi:EAL domain-containing protein (putative c-di-GMP-specific phosphodiesterase class I)/transposase
MGQRARVRKLTDEERRRLARIVRRGGGKTDKSMLEWQRAMIVSASTTGGASDFLDARRNTSHAAIKKLVRRFNKHGMASLSATSSDRPFRVTAQDLAFVVDLAENGPEAVGLPFSHWTLGRLCRFLATNERRPLFVGRNHLARLLADQQVLLACPGNAVAPRAGVTAARAETGLATIAAGGFDARAPRPRESVPETHMDPPAQRTDLGAELRNAVRQDQLHLVYQPIVDIHRGVATGLEALVRWDHPARGMLFPQSFIALAEESDAMLEIGTWVLDEALAQLACFRQLRGLEQMTISVNFSGLQLRDQLLLQRVSRAITANGLPGSAVTLELAESILRRDPEAATASCKALRRIGVRFAVDDFGTRYSSLAHLQELPIDVLKIDRSFASGISQPDTSYRPLIAAMLALARVRGIETVAEGVETEEQAVRLRELGCTAAQGYLFGGPVRAVQVVETITAIAAAFGARHHQAAG